MQLKAIETCYSMFSSADISRVLGYIHSVAPHIVAVIQQAAKNTPSSEVKLTVIQKSIDTVELLVGLAEEDRRKYISRFMMEIDESWKAKVCMRISSTLLPLSSNNIVLHQS